MLKYLVILLDRNAPSFCHYDMQGSDNEQTLIALSHLKKAIRFAMLENLNVQYVWPDYILPEEYLEVMDSVDHINIVPVSLSSQADVVVCGIDDLINVEYEANTVLRCSLQEFLTQLDIVVESLKRGGHLSVVFNDLPSWTGQDLKKYEDSLSCLAQAVVNLYIDGFQPQINLLTDRLFLKEMNNCNAGWESLAVGPDGYFYACPAFFYFDHPDSKLGSLDSGLDIKNPQLYRLSHAPICSNCDAWHCKRCIWLNKSLTREVNTPGRMQCISAHIERKASAELKKLLLQAGISNPHMSEIPEIDYLDPFDKRKEWL